MPEHLVPPAAKSRQPEQLRVQWRGTDAGIDPGRGHRIRLIEKRPLRRLPLEPLFQCFRLLAPRGHEIVRRRDDPGRPVRAEVLLAKRLEKLPPGRRGIDDLARDLHGILDRGHLLGVEADADGSPLLVLERAPAIRAHSWASRGLGRARRIVALHRIRGIPRPGHAPLPDRRFQGSDGARPRQLDPLRLLVPQGVRQHCLGRALGHLARPNRGPEDGTLPQLAREPRHLLRGARRDPELLPCVIAERRMPELHLPRP